MELTWPLPIPPPGSPVSECLRNVGAFTNENCSWPTRRDVFLLKSKYLCHYCCAQTQNGLFSILSLISSAWFSKPRTVLRRVVYVRGPQTISILSYSSVGHMLHESRGVPNPECLSTRTNDTWLLGWNLFPGLTSGANAWGIIHGCFTLSSSPHERLLTRFRINRLFKILVDV